MMTKPYEIPRLSGVSHFQTSFMPLLRLQDPLWLQVSRYFENSRIKIIRSPPSLPLEIAWSIIVSSVFFQLEKTDLHMRRKLMMGRNSNTTKFSERNEIAVSVCKICSGKN